MFSYYVGVAQRLRLHKSGSRLKHKWWFLTSEHFAIFLQPGGAQTLTDFHVKWSLWHEEVDHCLQDSSFSSNKHLEVICKVSERFLSQVVPATLTPGIPRYLLFTVDPGWR